MKLALLLIASLACLACSALRAFDPTKPLPEEELKRYQACHHHAECVRVDNGCCDCANGGDTVAINRKYEKAFRENFQCARVLCPQKPGACNFLEPICHQGYCKLGPQWQWFPRKIKDSASPW